MSRSKPFTDAKANQENQIQIAPEPSPFIPAGNGPAIEIAAFPASAPQETAPGIAIGITNIPASDAECSHPEIETISGNGIPPAGSINQAATISIAPGRNTIIR